MLFYEIKIISIWYLIQEILICEMWLNNDVINNNYLIKTINNRNN